MIATPITSRPWPWWAPPERFSTEIRNLQRTDVLEVENFAKGRKAVQPCPISATRSAANGSVDSPSSAQLHHRSPGKRGAWHERDISHSSTERMMLPDCSVTLHFMLRRDCGGEWTGVYENVRGT